MKTRMQKYYDSNDTNTLLRQHKNEELYENINQYENLDYKVNSNVTVLDNNAQNIDVEHIKKILDTRYKEAPKRRSIVIDEEENIPEVNLDETREYDINAILERARSEKEAHYEEERLKKIRDTQYDILNSLDLEKEETKEIPREQIEPKKEEKPEATELMELINTITARELTNKKEKEIIKQKVDPLDILIDLKGDENTIVVGGAKESESVNETSPIMSLEEADKIKPQVMDKQKEIQNTLQFTQSDFDDFNDLKKEVNSNKALIYIIITLIILVFIAGLVIFLNKFLNLNWF